MLGSFQRKANKQSESSEAGALRFRMSHGEASTLPVEQRRALAVFRAIDIDSDQDGARALLAFSGAPIPQDEEPPTIAREECEALADALRSSGYPLDNVGIPLFKMERGYSQAVRIGPDIAAAYAHHARGCETKLMIPVQIWRRMDVEARRSARILMLIGRQPTTLIRVRAALDLTEREPATANVIPVGRASAKRLLRWAHALGITFTDAGMTRLVTATGLRARTIDAELAAFIADAIIARYEPAHDYERMVRPSNGDYPIILNARTWDMLARTERSLGDILVRVTRGSYEDELTDTRGAHPHTGGGVVDIRFEPETQECLNRGICALREVGFAAWFRPRDANPHVHAIAIGDRDLSAAARWQIKSYFQGHDGRSRSEPDPQACLGAEPPTWTVKYRVRYAEKRQHGTP